MRGGWVIACLVAASCISRIERRVGPELQTVDLKSPYLKLHMHDGDLYILSAWKIDEAGKAISGSGEHQGPNRQPISRDQVHRISLADVALFETNTVITSPGVAGLAVITGLSLAGTA